MALVGDARAQAHYDALNGSGKLNPLNDEEKATLLAQMKAFWGTDTSYLTTHAVVLPNTFAVPSGVAVATTGTAAAQSGATTAPGTVGGTGKLS